MDKNPKSCPPERSLPPERFNSPVDIQPLLLTDNPTSDRTVAWIGPCTTSKVVFIQLGHDHTPFGHPSYRALVHNSILWTAGKLN